MNHPLQITFRHMEVSPAVEARIHEEVAALEHFFNRINSCRVVVEAPHRHHQRGRGFHINIDLRVPGSEIVVNHEPSLHGSLAQGETDEWEKHLETQPDHKDIYVSIRDAFAAARRQLEDHARVIRGDTKHHAGEATAP
jgi:ribosome-associated translation inhibitor RaiA